MQPNQRPPPPRSRTCAQAVAHERDAAARVSQRAQQRAVLAAQEKRGAPHAAVAVSRQARLLGARGARLLALLGAAAAVVAVAVVKGGACSSGSRAPPSLAARPPVQRYHTCQPAGVPSRRPC